MRPTVGVMARDLRHFGNHQCPPCFRAHCHGSESSDSRHKTYFWNPDLSGKGSGSLETGHQAKSPSRVSTSCLCPRDAGLTLVCGRAEGRRLTLT
eukprot:8491922-Karenia_brevis.AAC.1